MDIHKISTGKRFPGTAVVIALALAIALSVLATQGVALLSTKTSPAATQQGFTGSGSYGGEGSPCAVKSTPTVMRWCISNAQGRQAGGTRIRPTPEEIAAQKS